MILNKAKGLLQEFRNQYQFLNSQNAELDWANIYHDTIRGRKWLEELPLSPGRWAANYSFLYILTRILADYKPSNIIEFGLGESTKIISSFLKNENSNAYLTTIEHNADWIKVFQNRFSIAANVNIVFHSLEKIVYKGFQTYSYENIQSYKSKIYQLYLLDGASSDRYSRNYVIELFENVTPEHEFIVIIDDNHRIGEQDTSNELISYLERKQVKIYTQNYAGSKTQKLIATDKYRFAASL